MNRTEGLIKSLDKKIEHKVSFSNILNVENDKVGLRHKSRNRSIRDNTSRSQSRTLAQNPNYSQTNININNKSNNNNNTNTDTNNNNTYQSDKDNNKNDKKQSIQNIRKNMRKQSIENERRRSKSMKRRSANNSINKIEQNNSLSKSRVKVNKFAISNKNIEAHHNPKQQNNEEQTHHAIKQYYNELNVKESNSETLIKQMKMRVKQLQNKYSKFPKPELILSYNNNSNQQEKERRILLERTEDLSNILDAFHIGYKQNLLSLHKQLNERIDAQTVVEQQDKQDNQEFMLSKLDKEYALANLINNSNVKKNRQINNFFSEFQRKIGLNQTRLLNN